MDKSTRIILAALGISISVVVWFNRDYLWRNVEYVIAPPIDASTIENVIPGTVTSAEVKGEQKVDLSAVISKWKPTGISNLNLSKIPVAVIAGGDDTDDDGLGDALERALGTSSVKVDSDSDGYADGLEVKYNHNPLGAGFYPIDFAFANSLKGKLFVQVESKGELWYITSEGNRYYLTSQVAEKYLSDKTPVVEVNNFAVAAVKPVSVNALKNTTAALKVNTLYIQSLKLQVPVVYVAKANEDSFQKGLEGGVVHYPGTAYPGQYGNVYIFGHSSDYRWRSGSYKAVFAVLPQIKIGAEILITSATGQQFKYKVFTSKSVAATDTQYLGQYDFKKKLLTLQTSWPIGTALKRWVVIAELVE